MGNYIFITEEKPIRRKPRLKKLPQEKPLPYWQPTTDLYCNSPNVKPYPFVTNPNQDPNIYTYFLDAKWSQPEEVVFPHDGREHPMYKGQKSSCTRYIDNESFHERNVEYDLVMPLKKFDLRCTKS